MNTLDKHGHVLLSIRIDNKIQHITTFVWATMLEKLMFKLIYWLTSSKSKTKTLDLDHDYYLKYIGIVCRKILNYSYFFLINESLFM